MPRVIGHQVGPLPTLGGIKGRGPLASTAQRAIKVLERYFKVPASITIGS